MDSGVTHPYVDGSCHETMPSLYSYVLRYDSGLAPNPFCGTCTLVVCKPKIRQSARVGDWVVGLCPARQRRAAFGDVETPGVVYAMEVTETLEMEAYDAHTRSLLPGKIPDPLSSDPVRRAGDSLYDFQMAGPAGERPAQRPGLHDESHRVRDLGGGRALLSDHFYYFGREPVPLPPHLWGVALYSSGAHLRQGHLKPTAFLRPFRVWIGGQGYAPHVVHTMPTDLDAGPSETPPCGRTSGREVAGPRAQRPERRLRC